MQERLINIEEKIAHLENYLGALDGVIRDMNDRMDGFRRQLDALREMVATPAADAESAADRDDDAASDDALLEDQPPHW